MTFFSGCIPLRTISIVFLLLPLAFSCAKGIPDPKPVDQIGKKKVEPKQLHQIGKKKDEPKLPHPNGKKKDEPKLVYQKTSTKTHELSQIKLFDYSFHDNELEVHVFKNINKVDVKKIDMKYQQGTRQYTVPGEWQVVREYTELVDIAGCPVTITDLASHLKQNYSGRTDSRGWIKFKLTAKNGQLSRSFSTKKSDYLYEDGNLKFTIECLSENKVLSYQISRPNNRVTPFIIVPGE